MNPLQLTNAFSMRRELYLVLCTFALALALPLIAVIVVTHTGTQLVSDQLVQANTTKNTVEILSPLDGSVVTSYTGTFTWPTHGAITLRFGESSRYQPFHTGLDLAGGTGTPVTPFLKGKVMYAGQTPWGYGKHLIIDHGDNLTSYYAHLNQMNVSVGQDVSPGDVIGCQGQTGWATGPHLHFEVRLYGIPVNPLVFFAF